MKTKRTAQQDTPLSVATALITVASRVIAGDVGHFGGGMMDIRDYFLPPESGIYGALHHYGCPR